MVGHYYAYHLADVSRTISRDILDRIPFAWDKQLMRCTCVSTLTLVGTRE